MLQSLNRRLAATGAAPIVVPPEAELSVTAGADGIDLP